MEYILLFFQYHELLGHCAVPVWNGCHDHAENSAQGHCQIQPGGPGKDTKVSVLLVQHICELQLLVLTSKRPDVILIGNLTIIRSCFKVKSKLY